MKKLILAITASLCIATLISSAINNKIKPFFCHFFKYKILKL